MGLLGIRKNNEEQIVDKVRLVAQSEELSGFRQVFCDFLKPFYKKLKKSVFVEEKDNVKAKCLLLLKQLRVIV